MQYARLTPKSPLRQVVALDLLLSEYQSSCNTELLPQAEAAALVILDRIREEMARVRLAAEPPPSPYDNNPMMGML